VRQTLRHAALVSIGAAVAVVLLHGLQLHLDEARAARQRLQQFMFVPPGEHLRIAALGYEQTVADLVWIQAVQAMGERKVTPEAGVWLVHALDVITTLDPRFVRVYVSGGIALTTLVSMYADSNRLLQKGMTHNPGVWELPFFLGFNYYFEEANDLKAAEYISRASRLPGAPEFLAPLAARLYVSARTPEDAIDFLTQVYDQTKDENVKRVLAQRLKEVVVERDLLLLEEAIRRYRDLYGRAPGRLADLVGPALLRRLPPEPFGGRYLYDPQTETVKSSEVKERMKAYSHRRAP